MRVSPMFAIVSLECLVTACGAQAAPVDIADGDSFRIGGQRYRLHGIDAPELHQDCIDALGKSWPCGRRARTELQRIIGTQPVNCRAVVTDRFGRIVATCMAGGRDLAEEMVRTGYAMSSPSRGAANPYEHAQSEARAGKRGLWVGTFETPRDWRRNHPRDDESAASASTGQDWLRQKLGEAKQSLSNWLQAVWGR